MKLLMGGNSELWNGDQCLSNAISDSVPDGQLHVPLYGPGTYKIRGLSVEGQPGPWSNEIAA